MPGIRASRYIITRESNVVRIDFSRDPDPPAPRFPGAAGLRESIGQDAAESMGGEVAAMPLALAG